MQHPGRAKAGDGIDSMYGPQLAASLSMNGASAMPMIWLAEWSSMTITQKHDPFVYYDNMPGRPKTVGSSRASR